MAVSCSFKAIVGSPCSDDRRDQSKSVSIVLCKRHRKSQVALVFYRGNWRARTHSSKSGYFHHATGYKQSNYLSLSSVGAWPCRERRWKYAGKETVAKFRMLQIEEGKHVHFIYTFLLYRHERFTGKYRNIPLVKFIKITSGTHGPSGSFSVISHASLTLT